jgi:hypothetical protein
MRRIAALVILGALGGCSGTSSPAGVTPTPTPAAGASAPGVAAQGTTVDPSAASAASAAESALTGNTKAICEQAARTSASFGETFIADLRLQIDAPAKGGHAKTQADQKVTRDVQNYSYALADMAKLTTDAALKKALNQMSAQVMALKGDVTKINADKMSELSATLDKACGKS